LTGIFLCKLAITHQAAGRSPAVIGDKTFITEFGGGGIIYEAVGLIALCVMGRRKSGRAEYTPLWRCGGGGGRTPP
jgi:hypothetical protein